MNTDLSAALAEQLGPNFVNHLSQMGVIGDGARLTNGMSAHGGTAKVYTRLFEAMESGRAYRMGWLQDDTFYDLPDDGIDQTLNFMDTEGEHRTTYFTFDPSRSREFDRHGPDGEMTADEAADHYLKYMFGYGYPCDCGICNAGGDCCGRWFTTSVRVWPAGDGRWHGVAHFARNI